VRVNLDSGSLASATLSPNGGDDGITFSVASSSEARFSLVYGLEITAVGFDLTSGGSDRFLVTLGSVVPDNVVLRVESTDRGICLKNCSPSLLTVSGQNEYEFAFADIVGEPPFDEIHSWVLYVLPPPTGPSALSFL
jgi:hypothetical protein